MKVLMVYPGIAPVGYRNGVVTVMNNLPKSLETKNCEVRTIQLTKGKASNEADSKNILVHAEKADLRSQYRLASEVKKEASKGKYDVVHGHTLISVLYKFLRSNVPVCVTDHGIGYKVYHCYWKYKATKNLHDLLPYLQYYPLKAYDILGGRLFCNMADRVTAVSSFCKQEVSEIYGVPEEKIDSIPNGVPLELFTTNIPEKEKNKIMERYNFEKALLFLPPVPRKGLHFLIKALPNIIKEVPNLKVLVVGGLPTFDTYYKFCHELSQKLHVEERVLFVGWVDDIDLPKYYAAVSAYVLPSSYESFGLTVIESMACGTPVCASKGLGFPEIITDGEDGFLRDPADAASLAEALTTILNDDVLRKRMGHNARQKIESQYSWSKIADQYIEAYEKTIQGGQS
jgi:glycosyltransferase involved in cell wall biosynthesis